MWIDVWLESVTVCSLDNIKITKTITDEGLMYSICICRAKPECVYVYCIYLFRYTRACYNGKQKNFNSVCLHIQNNATHTHTSHVHTIAFSGKYVSFANQNRTQRNDTNCDN